MVKHKIFEDNLQLCGVLIHTIDFLMTFKKVLLKPVCIGNVF